MLLGGTGSYRTDFEVYDRVMGGAQVLRAIKWLLATRNIGKTLSVVLLIQN